MLELLVKSDTLYHLGLKLRLTCYLFFLPPSSNNQANQNSPIRQQWQTQQQPLRGQVMQQQLPLQQETSQKRTIMIQSNSPAQSNIIRLQPNSNFSANQPRMMQIQPSNNGTIIHSSSQPINNPGPQQYHNIRMTNTLQGPNNVVRTNGPPRVQHNMNIRQMTTNGSQGQYQVQSMSMHQQSPTIQQQAMPNQRLQSPMNQWESRPRVSLQANQHQNNPRSSAPQQSFAMQMRPTGQPMERPVQVSIQAPQHHFRNFFDLCDFHSIINYYIFSEFHITGA